MAGVTNMNQATRRKCPVNAGEPGLRRLWSAA